ncbi:MAG: hypothetical protein WAM39_05195, partial [Bryobacteraceae bacterium]
AAAGMIVAIAVIDWWTRIYVSLGRVERQPPDSRGAGAGRLWAVRVGLLRARRLNLETHGRLRALIETSPAAIVMAD